MGDSLKDFFLRLSELEFAQIQPPLDQQFYFYLEYRMKRISLLVASLIASGAVSTSHAAMSINVSKKDIGGVVASPKGPEAGVWVIAETTDLPTKFAKVVVTDDQGRFLIPDMPSAKYQVWVRGYGLVDSPKVAAKLGQTLNLKAVAAPDEKSAAAYYPGMYWYSLLEIPAESEFPGTGDKGNGIPTFLKKQYYWIDTVKNSCQSCHALGSSGMRNVPAFFKEKAKGDSFVAWAHRTQAGQAMAYMGLALGRLGPEKGLELFSNWTDSIEKGALPFAKPKRPEGIERNMVYSSWDYSRKNYYLHDGSSTDKRNPTVNANGAFWGSPEESTNNVPYLDPIKNVAGEVTMPMLDPKQHNQKDQPKGPSAYWGEEAIWDGSNSIHNNTLDAAGRVWFSAKLRNPGNPDFCKAGSDHPSAKVLPINESIRQLAVYDPAKKDWSLVNTCFTTHHLYFARDKNDTLWTSAGGPGFSAVGWLNTKMYLETKDEQKSQGWTPIVLDYNGNGKRDEYTEIGQPADASKDKRVMTGFYAVQTSPVDNSVWGQSMDVGFSRVDQPGFLIRLNPGSDPSTTALAEIYRAPEGTYGLRGIDIDSKGVVWSALSSGQLASFDRSKCKAPLNGPAAAEGKHCPEGWSTFRMPGPQFKGVNDPNGSANHAYYVWVDLDNTLGLGKDVPVAMANGGEELLALVDGKMVSLRIPYPMGFFSKNVDGRIDDPKAGWKGRALWVSTGTRTALHGEGGKDNLPKVYKVQIRPNPLAN